MKLEDVVLFFVCWGGSLWHIFLLMSVSFPYLFFSIKFMKHDAIFSKHLFATNQFCNFWLIACFSIHLLTWFFSQLWPSLWKRIEWHGGVSPPLLFDIATMTSQKQQTHAKDNQTNNEFGLIMICINEWKCKRVRILWIARILEFGKEHPIRRRIGRMQGLITQKIHCYCQYGKIWFILG